MRPIACLLAASLLAACSHDLNLPPASTAPRVETITPAFAYAGQRVVIRGAGFDPVPEGNLVQFAGVSARAESASGDALWLRVPADAGTGPITVTTRGGISGPSATPFTYLGLGEVRGGAVSSEIPLLHRPYRVLGLEGDTFIHSDLILGILRYGDPSFVVPQGRFMDAAPWTTPGSIVWRETAGATAGLLVRRTVGNDPESVTTAAIPAVESGPVVAMRAHGGLPDAVAVLQHQGDPAYLTTVSLHRLDDLTPIPTYEGAALARFEDLRGCADTGSGQLVCLVRREAGGHDGLVASPLTLGIVSFEPSVSSTLLAPPPVALVEDRNQLDDPLCVDPTLGAGGQAVVALEDGSLALVDLATRRFLASTVETGSRTPVRSINCLGGGEVLVAKRGDDLLTRLRLADGRIVWSVPVPKASRAGVDCSAAALATAGACTVHVMGEADNAALVLRLDTGALLARRSFDLLPGRIDTPEQLLDRSALQGAAAYTPADGVPRIAVVVSAPRGVLRAPVSAQRGSGLYPTYAQADAVAVVPGLAGSYAMVLEDLALDGAAVSSTARLGLDGAWPYAYAGTRAGLETLTFDNGTAGAVSAWEDAEFYSLGYLPDGRIFGAIYDSWLDDTFLKVWTLDEAHQGQQAGATWSPVSPLGTSALLGMAAVLDGELWAFWWDRDAGGDLQLHATGLTARSTSLSETSSFVVADLFYQVLAVSPNGRTFVSWDLQPFSHDTSVVLWSADSAAGFPRRTTIPVQGQVTGVAFSDTGEALYVVTRGPDRILVVE
jgi:hypothetical protein